MTFFSILCKKPNFDKNVTYDGLAVTPWYNLICYKVIFLDQKIQITYPLAATLVWTVVILVLWLVLSKSLPKCLESEVFSWSSTRNVLMFPWTSDANVIMKQTYSKMKQHIAKSFMGSFTIQYSEICILFIPYNTNHWSLYVTMYHKTPMKLASTKLSHKPKYVWNL